MYCCYVCCTGVHCTPSVVISVCPHAEHWLTYALSPDSCCYATFMEMQVANTGPSGATFYSYALYSSLIQLSSFTSCIAAALVPPVQIAPPVQLDAVHFHQA
jgi:hypothetical protein